MFGRGIFKKSLSRRRKDAEKRPEKFFAGLPPVQVLPFGEHAAEKFNSSLKKWINGGITHYTIDLNCNVFSAIDVMLEIDVFKS